MASGDGSPAEWHRDPSGRYEYRWWDGTGWTSSVSTGGQIEDDSNLATSLLQSDSGNPSPPPPNSGQATRFVPVDDTDPAEIRAQIAKVDGIYPTRCPAGHYLLDELVLVINQKPQLVQSNTRFNVYNSAGIRIGGVSTTRGQNGLRVYEIVDLHGHLLLSAGHRTKFVGVKLVITGPTGGLVGQIVSTKVLGRMRLGLRFNDQEVGSIVATSWSPKCFEIRDGNDEEIARITKTWEGLVPSLFTRADNYVLQVHAPLSEPLRSLIIVSAICLDSALEPPNRV